MNPDPAALVRRHQGGVLLDTNVLLLYLAVRTDIAALWEWKRLNRFTERHVEVLNTCIGVAKHWVTTPHVLAEVTNFAESVPLRLRPHYRENLRVFIAKARERWRRAALVASDKDFVRFGLTDTALAHLPRRAKPVVLTVDADLAVGLENRGLPVLNLTNYVYPV